MTCCIGIERDENFVDFVLAVTDCLLGFVLDWTWYGLGSDEPQTVVQQDTAPFYPGYADASSLSLLLFKIPIFHGAFKLTITQGLRRLLNKIIIGRRWRANISHIFMSIKTFFTLHQIYFMTSLRGCSIHLSSGLCCSHLLSDSVKALRSLCQTSSTSISCFMSPRLWGVDKRITITHLGRNHRHEVVSGAANSPDNCFKTKDRWHQKQESKIMPDWI